MDPLYGEMLKLDSRIERIKGILKKYCCVIKMVCMVSCLCLFDLESDDINFNIAGMFVCVTSFPYLVMTLITKKGFEPNKQPTNCEYTKGSVFWSSVNLGFYLAMFFGAVYFIVSHAINLKKCEEDDEKCKDSH
jgi:hypothetical protein